MTIMARSSSLALTVAVVAIICCSMPRSTTAIRVVPDGFHGSLNPPPSPQPHYAAHGQPYTGPPCRFHGHNYCEREGQQPPPATSPPPMPRRKTIQVAAN
uniref:Predicted protein n=1 Tax=Hordeum vulgare subsp. vulgare TaxID=112509 RepID=F2DAG7_HORVV|nr:predicted protein [Hordeum vulgare subsp. vulgare]